MSDPRKASVRHGYDAAAFAGHRPARGPETTWLLRLLEELPENAWVLDLGCGDGAPIAVALAGAGHEVTGVDLSVEQITHAKALVPDARFIVGDMTSVCLAERYFHACIAWDSMFHLPPEDQPAMFRRVHSWLQPRSPFVVTFGGEGAMDPREALQQLRAAGFKIIEYAVDDFRGAGHMVVWAQS